MLVLLEYLGNLVNISTFIGLPDEFGPGVKSKAGGGFGLGLVMLMHKLPSLARSAPCI